MKSVSLNASPRAAARRAGAKQLRAAGRVPAVIYGRQAKPQNLELSDKEFRDLIQRSASENLLVDLSVKDDARPKRLALVQEIQHNALSGAILHVDFHEIAENEKVTIGIPVETVGEAEGVKTEGGVLEHVLFKVKARGLTKDLPEVLTVDVSHLKIGMAVHLGELKTPAGVELIGDKHIPVIACAAPRTEEEEAAEAAAAAEGAAAGDVEMIKEKKEEGEEGAAAKPGEKGAAPAGAKGAAAPAGAKGAGAAPAAGKGAPAAPAAGGKPAAEKKK